MWAGTNGRLGLHRLRARAPPELHKSTATLHLLWEEYQEAVEARGEGLKLFNWRSPGLKGDSMAGLEPGTRRLTAACSGVAPHRSEHRSVLAAFGGRARPALKIYWISGSPSRLSSRPP